MDIVHHQEAPDLKFGCSKHTTLMAIFVKACVCDAASSFNVVRYGEICDFQPLLA